MATAVGTGFNVSNLEKELDRLDKKLETLINKGKKTQDAIEKMLVGKNADQFLTKIEKIKQSVIDLSTTKDPLKWNSEKLKGYIDNVNKLFRTINQINAVNGGEKKLIDTAELEKARKDLKSVLTEVKSLEKARSTSSTKRSQTYSGSLKYSSNAKTLEQDRQAVINLEAARAKLKKTDEDYKNKLQTLNAAIERHNKSIRKATETSAQYEARKKNTMDKWYSSTPDRALGYSSNAKTLEQERQAVRYLESARAKLNTTTEEGKNKMAEINRRINEHNKNIRNAANGTKELQTRHKELSDSSSRLAGVLARVFSVYAIKGYIQKLADVRGEYELQQRSLQAIVQNVDKANKLWDKTIALAVRSPFRVKDLVTYTKQLAAYQIESEKLYDTTKMLADVSAGLGVDMNRLILAYGQVKSANFLRGTELRQFTEAGIPMLDELAKYYSEIEKRAVSAAEVFGRISKRGVAFEDVDAVFKKITGEGGIFYEMQEKQSNTLKGMISNLRDSIDLMLNDIGQAQDGTLKSIIAATKDIIENWRVIAVVIKQVGFAAAIAALRNLVVGWKAVTLATFEGTAAMRGAERAGASLRLGLQKLFATMKANPLLFVLGAVASLGHAWYNHKKAVDAANKKYDELSTREIKQMDNLRNIKKDIEDNNKVISDSTKTQEEQNEAIEKNNSILAKLKSEYPGLYDAIKQQADGTIELNEAIEEQNRKLSANIVLQQQAKRGNFYEDLTKNYQDAIDARTKEESKINDVRSKALEMKAALVANKSKIDETEYEQVYDWLQKVSEAQTHDEIRELRYGEESSKILKAMSSKTAKTIGLREFNEMERQVEWANSTYQKQLTNLSKNLDRQMNTYLVEMTEIKGDDEEDKSKKRGAWLKEQLENLGVIDEEIQNWAKDYISKEIKLDIVWPDPEKEKKVLQKWQESYNKKFGDNEETVDIDERFGGFIKIQNINTTRESVIERLQTEYKDTKDLIAKIEALGVDKATMAGGAYEGVDFNKLKNDIKDIESQLDWFGAPYEKKQKKGIDILNKRISLIKEMYERYKDLRKEQDHESAYKDVAEAYEDTFNEAFEGTGIDFSSVAINMDRIDDMVAQAAEAGGEVGGAFSEEMLAKMTELSEKGTHIRTYSDEFVTRLTSELREGFRSKPYWLEGEYWDKEGKEKKYTYGYGFTTKEDGSRVKPTDQISREEADLVLRKKLTEEYVPALNIVLDANKDLIFTQEQYNELLDATYQGWTGGVKTAINGARDIEKGVAHIVSMRGKIESVMGEEAASRFGDAFVQKFRETESIYERIAMLLETINLTKGNKVVKSDYKGMQSRSDKRVEGFTGDLEVVKLLQKAAIDVNNIDFTNIKGVIGLLKQLEPLATKEGKEAEVALSRAISGFEAQLDLEVNVKSREEIERSIDSMFGNYEVSLEMEKLNIPDDLAQRLFGFENIDINEIRGRILGEFGLLKFEGLSNEEIFKLDEFKNMAEERQNLLKESLQKEEEIQNEYIEKNAKDFIRFLKKDGDEIANAYRESGIHLGIADRLFKEGKISAEEYGLALKRIVKETNEEVGKIRLENLKKTPLYIEAMGAMYNKTKKEIQSLIDEIEKLAEANKDSLSQEEAEEYSKVIVKLKKDMADWTPILYDDDIQRVKDYISLSKELTLEKEKQANLEKTKADHEGQLKELTTQLETLQQNPEVDGNAEKIQSTMTAIKAVNGQLLSTNAQLSKTSANIEGMEGKMEGISNGASKGMLVTTTVINKMSQSLKAASKTFNDVKELAGSFGVDTESESWEKASSVMETMGGVGEELSQGWQNILSGNIIGAISNGIAAITKLIVGINKFKDIKYSEEIERQAKNIENLEQKFEDLDRAMDKAYTVEGFAANQKAMEQNLQAQMDAIEAQRAAEEAKKKTDKEALEEYDKQLKELAQKEEDLKKEFVESVGGSYDFVGVAEEFLDAWLEAFNETGDGLSGLENSFDEFWKGILKKQVVLGGASKIMEKYMSEINKALDDGKLSDKEIQDLEDKEAKAKEDLDEFYKWAHSKYDLSSESDLGELSGLSSGISGITEEQADVLAGYWNAVRFSVASIDLKMDSILANMNIGPDSNPMVDQLKLILNESVAIKDALRSIIYSNSSSANAGGTGIKVYLG